MIWSLLFTWDVARYIGGYKCLSSSGATVQYGDSVSSACPHSFTRLLTETFPIWFVYKLLIWGYRYCWENDVSKVWQWCFVTKTGNWMVCKHTSFMHSCSAVEGGSKMPASLHLTCPIKCRVYIYLYIQTCKSMFLFTCRLPVAAVSAQANTFRNGISVQLLPFGPSAVNGLSLTQATFSTERVWTTSNVSRTLKPCWAVLFFPQSCVNPGLIYHLYQTCAVSSLNKHLSRDLIGMHCMRWVICAHNFIDTLIWHLFGVWADLWFSIQNCKFLCIFVSCVRAWTEWQ